MDKKMILHIILLGFLCSDLLRGNPFKYKEQTGEEELPGDLSNPISHHAMFIVLPSWLVC